MKKTVGVVGQGFVGSAVKEGLSHSYKINTYDIHEDSTCSSLKELSQNSNYIFLCLPTPMRPDGSCDLSIVKNVVFEIDSYKKNKILT